MIFSKPNLFYDILTHMWFNFFSAGSDCVSLSVFFSSSAHLCFFSNAYPHLCYFSSPEKKKTEKKA